MWVLVSVGSIFWPELCHEMKERGPKCTTLGWLSWRFNWRQVIKSNTVQGHNPERYRAVTEAQFGKDSQDMGRVIQYKKPKLRKNRLFRVCVKKEQIPKQTRQQ